MGTVLGACWVARWRFGPHKCVGRGDSGRRRSLTQVRFCRYRFCATGELKYRGAVG
jgi:hypothetical protein